MVQSVPRLRLTRRGSKIEMAIPTRVQAARCHGEPHHPGGKRIVLPGSDFSDCEEFRPIKRHVLRTRCELACPQRGVNRIILSSAKPAR